MTLTLPQPLSVPSRTVLGHVEPRLWTAPLRELTPETSYGFEVIDFARDILGMPLDSWQEWLVIHAGELLEGGRPRFRKVLVIVARQNGKTHLLKVLALYWLFVEQWPMLLGTSANLATAKEAWEGAIEMALGVPLLAGQIQAVMRGNNDTHLKLKSGGKYKIAAANRKGGRGLTLDRLIMDELREQHNYTAWKAAMPAMNARPDAQAWLITNQGEDKSIVLNSLRDTGVQALGGNVIDPELGFFEWSAPDGASPLDLDALAQANPNLGHRLRGASLLADAQRAVEAGGEELTGFRTEIMCQRVSALDAAVDPQAWSAGNVPGSLAEAKSRVALCLDVSVTRRHATLVAAAVMPDGRVRTRVVAAWEGPQATQELRRDLAGWVRKVGPQAFGWIPNGPAAALAADLKERPGRVSPFPANCSVEEIRAEVSAVCMGLADLVDAGQVLHSDDPLLNSHILAAEKLWSGDVWRFSRKGGGECDAAYAVAGAIHLAKTLPTPIGKPRILWA
ncbi:terminase large subunit [Micromonospora sp. C81]|uniref:terminase large subunit n=1 Tax=Micromonospora sp. C81 TaxID=2824881 RepID=UPI001B37EA67|nr:terminase large subunit [Micromonospora sp. C81]MBQ1039295.1 terminase [Micromonospora sp. C81]